MRCWWQSGPQATVFFFQAADGIRDRCVTGVQTCALFFSSRRRHTRSLCDWSSDVCSSDLSPPVAVLSHRVWQTTYGGDPSVIGSTFVVEGHPFTVIGVAPAGFFGERLEGRRVGEEGRSRWAPYH